MPPPRVTAEDQELFGELLDAFASPFTQSRVVLDFCERFLDGIGPDREPEFLELVRKRAAAKAEADPAIVYAAPTAVAPPDLRPFPDAMLPDELTEGPFDLTPYELSYFQSWRRSCRLTPLEGDGPHMLSEPEAGRLAELRGEV